MNLLTSTRSQDFVCGLFSIVAAGILSKLCVDPFESRPARQRTWALWATVFGPFSIINTIKNGFDSWQTWLLFFAAFGTGLRSQDRALPKKD